VLAERALLTGRCDRNAPRRVGEQLVHLLEQLGTVGVGDDLATRIEYLGKVASMIGRRCGG
jgi:hypothetical protein